MNIARNKYLDKIKPFINKPIIKIITGMRRVGKSYFFKQIIDELQNNDVPKENILYIDKDDIDFDFIDDYKQLNQYIVDKMSDIKGNKYLVAFKRTDLSSKFLIS